MRKDHQCPISEGGGDQQLISLYQTEMWYLLSNPYNSCRPQSKTTNFKCQEMLAELSRVIEAAFKYQCNDHITSSMYESDSVSHSVVSNSLRPHGLQLLCPWNSPGQNTGMGSHSRLQGIFLTQGLNRGLLHCSLILYLLRQQRSPRKTKCRT